MSSSSLFQRLFPAVLAVTALLAFYTAYRFRALQKPQDTGYYPAEYGVKQEPFPEYPDKIEHIRGLLSESRDDQGKEEFRELAGTVHGGADWVLLKLAALENKTKVYTPLDENFKPVLEIKAGKNSDGTDHVTIMISNRNAEQMNIAQVPSKVVWSFSRSGGEVKTVAGDPAVFGNKDDEQVLRLSRRSFWGITIPLNAEGLDTGEWDVTLTLVYDRREMQGFNIVFGEITSNAQKIIL